jgi:hypothetical protein
MAYGVHSQMPGCISHFPLWKSEAREGCEACGNGALATAPCGISLIYITYENVDGSGYPVTSRAIQLTHYRNNESHLQVDIRKFCVHGELRWKGPMTMNRSTS